MRAAWAMAAVLFGCSAVEAELPLDFGSTSTGDAASSTTDHAPTRTSADTEPDPMTSSGAADGEDDSTTAALPDPALVEIEPGPIDDAELVGTLPVARNETGAERRVVLQLGPERLPELQRGDRLLAAAEVQVTTRCDVGQTAPGCGYDPTIAAQLVLTGDPADVDPAGAESIALSEVQTLVCTKGEHHCMFVFRPDESSTSIDDAAELPCIAAGECNVSLVMWAWDPGARADGVDKVLVGENEGDYLVNHVVQGDKARLMAVRERGPIGDDVDERETTDMGALAVPTDASSTLVYSHLLVEDGLRTDEQFVVEAMFVTAVSARARVSSKLFVTRDPTATDGNGIAAIAPTQIGEHNGTNCTAGASPCTTRKVAVFRATADVEGPVYVHVIVKSAVPGGGSANVTVDRSAGWLRSTRYAATLRG